MAATGGRPPPNSSPPSPTSSTPTCAPPTDGQVNFHARVAANVLRTVERELLDETAGEVTAALDELGFADETQLAAAIRAGDLDGRADEVLPCLRTLVRHRLAIAHPGYDERK